MAYQVLYKLKDYRETFVFEKEHPKELRWDDRYKIYMLTEESKCQGIWLKDGNQLIAEALLTWNSDNIVHISGFTVLPSHRGKGVGYKMMDKVVEWAFNSNYEYLIGEARNGASWHIFKTLGAEELYVHKNWGKSQEDYVSFKLELRWQ